MAEQSERQPRARSLACEICGTEFGCMLDGPCWCADEPTRLPAPAPGGEGPRDCLCPACLRARAAVLKNSGRKDP